jgi:hypothetical protein
MNPSKQTQTFDDTLWAVGEQTFESLAFMLLMPEEEGAASDEWGNVARVNFTGPFGGCLFVAISPGMLDPLGANMLGIEPGEDPPEGVKLEDALKELLNVVCGNLLPAIAGAEDVFQIASPTMLEAPVLPEGMEGMEQRGRAELVLDSGRAELVLYLDAGTVVHTPSDAGAAAPANDFGEI